MFFEQGRSATRLTRADAQAKKIKGASAVKLLRPL